jgi:methionine synthase I (cobalamin-dependent)
MSLDELREKVARALRDHWLETNEEKETAPVWGDLGPNMRRLHLAEADAALAVVREAMREPTGEMLDAGWKASTVKTIYSAMLAASPLREPGKENDA